MRVERPALALRDLPRVEENEADPLQGVDADVLRLLAGPASLDAASLSGSVLAPLAPPPPAAFAALAVALPALASEERDHVALEALDAGGRAALAPRLAAVREMAEVASKLITLRGEVFARQRSLSEG